MNITEKKKEKEGLADAVRKLSTKVESLAFEMAAFGATDERIRDYNAAYTKLSGLRDRETFGSCPDSRIEAIGRYSIERL